MAGELARATIALADLIPRFHRAHHAFPMIVIGVAPVLKSFGYAVLRRQAGGLEWVEGEVVRTIREGGRSASDDARVRIRQIMVDVETLVRRHSEDDPSVSVAVAQVVEDPRLVGGLESRTGRAQSQLFTAAAPADAEAPASDEERATIERSYELAAAALRIVGALQAVADYALEGGRRVPFIEVGPAEIRQVCCGQPKASKAELRRAVAERFGRHHHEHVLDAAAVAIAAAHRAGPLARAS